MPTDGSQSFLAVTSFFNGKPTPGQRDPKHFAQRKLIIDNQNTTLL